MPSASDISGRSTRSRLSSARRSSTAISESMPISDSGRSGSTAGRRQAQDVCRFLGHRGLEQRQRLLGLEPGEALDQRVVAAASRRSSARMSAKSGAARIGRKRRASFQLVSAKRDHRQTAGEHRRQRRQGLRRRHRLGAEPARQRVAGLRPLGQIAGILDRPPGDRERRPALGPPPPRQRLERADWPRHRRPAPARRARSSPTRTAGTARSDRRGSGGRAATAPPSLGRRMSANGGAVEIGGQPVGDRRGGVHDAAQRRLRPADLVEHRRSEAGSATSAGVEADVGAERASAPRPARRLPAYRAPRRPSSAIEPAPCAASQRAAAKPNPEMPPVTR